MTSLPSQPSGEEILRDIEQGFLMMRKMCPDINDSPRKIVLVVGANVPQSYVELLQQEYPFATVTRTENLLTGNNPGMIVDELAAFECCDRNLEDYQRGQKLERERSSPYYRRFERKRRSR